MASASLGAGVSSLISVSHGGNYVVRFDGKELVIHTASITQDSRILEYIKPKEPMTSQPKFLKFSHSDIHNHDIEDENSFSPVPCLRLLYASDTHISVRQVNSPEWHVEIENIDPALASVDFGSSNDEVLMFHSWNIKATIFNLDTGRSQVIRSPKFSGVSGYGYRPVTRQLAILLKPEVSDLLTIHEYRTYELISRVILPTMDAQGLKWSPNGKWIAVWDTASVGTKVVIYTANGQHFRTYSGPPGSDNTYDLGIRTIEWNASFLAVGKFDGSVDLLNTKTFSYTTSFSHTFQKGNHSPKVWRELPLDAGGNLQYIEAPSPFAFDVSPDPISLHNGVSMMVFGFDGSDGTLLATLDQSRSNVLWIWSLNPYPCLESILVHQDSIRYFTWHSTRPQLLVTTNKSALPVVRLWSLIENPVIVRVPIPRSEAGRYQVTWVEAIHRGSSEFWFSTPDDCVLGYISVQGHRGEFNLLHSVPK